MTALILIVFLACVLVGGLELFTVTRIRDLAERNAALLDRLEQREGELKNHEQRLRALAPQSEVDERFTVAGAVADQRHDEVVQAVSSLRSKIEAVPARLRGLEEDHALSRGRIDGLAADMDGWEARLGELRKTIPAPFDESKLETLRGPIGALRADMTKHQKDLEALRHELRSVKHSCVKLGERLDDLERAAHENGPLAQKLDSVERIAGAAFTCVKEMQEGRATARAGEVTVRAALRVRSAALRNVIVLLFEEYMQAGGATIRLRWGAAGTLRYYLRIRDLGAFEQDCAEAIRTLRDSVTSAIEEPGRPTPHDAFFSILLSLAQAESAFAQLGPLLIARTREAFGCGLLDREGMYAFDVERCLGDPGATPDEVDRWSPDGFVDLSSLARASSAA